jgi:hypothetical protein
VQFLDAHRAVLVGVEFVEQIACDLLSFDKVVVVRMTGPTRVDFFVRAKVGVAAPSRPVLSATIGSFRESR